MLVLGLLWAIISVCASQCRILGGGGENRIKVRGCAGKLDIVFNQTEVELDLSHNNLTSLSTDDFYGFSSLKKLHLSYNNLRTLPENVFDEMPNLEELQLQGNNLTSLPKYVFDSLSSLLDLNLGWNGLTSLPEDVFDRLSTLLILNLAANNLTSLRKNVFNGMPRLKRLYIKDNRIELPQENAFANLPTLERLDLSENGLRALPDNFFDGMDSLQRLFLDKNDFTSLSDNVFDNVSKLTLLSLGHNNFTSLQSTVFRALDHLIELRLNYIPPFVLPANVFDGLSNLAYLYMQFTNLRTLPGNVFSGTPNLLILDLRGNNLTLLPQNVFDGLSKLRSLHLSDNELQRLPEHIFGSLSHLRELHLDSNRFDRIPCAVVNLPSELWILSFENNPFHPTVPLPQPWCNKSNPSQCDRNVTMVPCSRQVNCGWNMNVRNDCNATCGTEFGEFLCASNTVSISCAKECPGVHCRWSAWSEWTDHCVGNCGLATATKLRLRFIEQDPLHGGSPCEGASVEAVNCNFSACNVHCQWSPWSEWTDHCEGKCGLSTATKLRLRYIEQAPLHGGSPCEGASVEAVNCNFSACNASMYCDGSVLHKGFTREIFKERRRNCHEQCTEKCTAEDLCADAPIHRREAWVDPKWTRRWFRTTLSKFMAEVALGDSFAYPTAPSHYQPCMWLHPTCANASDCNFGRSCKPPKVTHLMDNFYHWYFSEGEIKARKKVVGNREVFSIGGKMMATEDARDPSRGRCVNRCLSWCYESCSCNWSWEFAWANDIDLGWKYGRPMRFRWIPSVPRNPSHGTWKCVSSEGTPLRTPWDKPSWSLDIYADKVKKMYEHFAPLQFHLVCDHVKMYYARQVCGAKVTKCPLNCTRAAQPVVDHLYAHGMLQSGYMQKGGKKRRAKLVDQLHADIHSNCRRTCATAHLPAFLHMYPDE